MRRLPSLSFISADPLITNDRARAGSGLFWGSPLPSNLSLESREAPVRIRLSLFPAQTVSAWLMLLIPVGVFLGTRALDHKRLYRLVQVLIAIACVQTILGLMQFGAGRESPLYLGMTFTSFGSAVGTYANRNHLAGLIEMALLITLALYIYNLGRTERQGTKGWKSRVVFFASMRGPVAFVYGALALLLLIGVIFTRSRTGIALTMLGMLLVTFAFLAGLFFSDPSQHTTSGSRRNGKRRTSNQKQVALVTADSKAVKPLAPAPDQIKNPFAD